MSQPRTLFRTRIKFCGFTRPGDVRLACELGADAIGFVFAAGSKRRVAPEEARAPPWCAISLTRGWRSCG